jgi:hypothetical protein
MRMLTSSDDRPSRIGAGKQVLHGSAGISGAASPRGVRSGSASRRVTVYLGAYDTARDRDTEATDDVRTWVRPRYASFIRTSWSVGGGLAR